MGLLNSIKEGYKESTDERRREKEARKAKERTPPLVAQNHPHGTVEYDRGRPIENEPGFKTLDPRQQRSVKRAFYGHRDPNEELTPRSRAPQADSKAGRLIGKVASAGANTIGRAVVEGGKGIGRGLKAAAIKGAENAAVNRGLATRQGGKVVKRQGASFMDFIGGGDPLMGPMGPPPGGGRQGGGRGRRGSGGGRQDIHIHVHTDGQKQRETSSTHLPQTGPRPEPGAGLFDESLFKPPKGRRLF